MKENILAIVFFALVMFYAVCVNNNQIERSEKCEKIGKVLVKSPTGFVCVSR